MVEIRKLLKYELATNIEALKDINLWLNLCAIGALIAALLRLYWFILIMLIIIIFLKLKLDSLSGDVINYYREKQGIPNSTKIKNLKEDVKTRSNNIHSIREERR